MKGPKSFEHLQIVGGFHTLKVAKKRMGLLKDDVDDRQCLLEAITIHMPSAVRRLLLTILAYCEPEGVQRLWDAFQSSLLKITYPREMLTTFVP